MKLDYLPLEAFRSLPKLDFTDNDNTDPLRVHEFYYNDLLTYSQNQLSKVWIVTKKGNNDDALAYFTTSMSAIELKVMDKLKEKVNGTTPIRYPAMLIGRMGVHKPYRNNCIGEDICNFCRGLAIDLNSRVACRYVVLQTNSTKAPFYKSCGFVQSNTIGKNGLIWMYTRIV